jgi:exodeoxyribonuclease VII large subunit
MFEIILKKLTIWRNEKARQENVDLFRILPSKTLEELAIRCPRDKKEMTAIKGIKEAKFRKYGKELLGIINSDEAPLSKKSNKDLENLNYFRHLSRSTKIETMETKKAMSVGEAWDLVNSSLMALDLRIRGEVTSVDIRSSAVYFSIKDKKDGSVMNCFIFRYQYDILAVDLHEGVEVVVEGYLEVYKPYGRLSLRTNVIELEGEGALKKEYLALKNKLEEEGLFAPETKKVLGRMPHNIGLITSKGGAAIGDFRSNIGRFGFRIRLVNSSVEGKKAVFELIEAIRYLRKQKDLDVIVIIRGGGSLESLQAFNNEALIREAVLMPIPLICGIGHDKDISLLSLAADYSVSTPTAAARLLGSLWESEIERLGSYQRNIFSSYDNAFRSRQNDIDTLSGAIEHGWRDIVDKVERVIDRLQDNATAYIENALRRLRTKCDDSWAGMRESYYKQIYDANYTLDTAEKYISLNDPARQLRLGYGIVSLRGKSIRSVTKLRKGDELKILLSDGEAKTSVHRIKKFKK